MGENLLDEDLEVVVGELVEEDRPTKKHPTRPDVVSAAERRAFTINLRKKGLTYRQIEAEVREYFGDENLPDGYSYRRAYKDVTTEMDKHRTQIHEDLESIIELELTRLDGMLEGIWEKAEKGNVSAIETVLKIMQRRSHLLGLDKPKKVSQTDPEGKRAVPRDVIIVREFLETGKLPELPEGGDNGGS